VPLGLPGIHAVGALVGHALGRARDRDAALAKFVAATRKPRRPLSEMWFGDSGVLATALGLRRHIDDARIGALIETLRSRVAAAPPLSGPAFAHGRAGVQRTLLLATRSTSIVADIEPPNIELVCSRAPTGLGLSLCNGLSGFVQLWVSAFEATGDAKWLDAARAAAPALESDLPESYSGGSVCCGLGGRAYALLAIGRIDPSGEWQPRARALALRALGDETLGHGVLGGLPGLVCLASDLTRKSIDEPLALLG
jgi:eukaryotic-like serine/threonine-protein kinase